MTAVIGALKELWGLFVDDGALALGLVAWCAFSGLVLPRLELPDGADAIGLALGCIAILVATLAAAARRHRSR